MTSKLRLEDFHTGQVFDLGSFTLSEQEIIDFATRFDPQPFHVDAAAARQSIFGELIASGWHTCSATMRLQCDKIFLQADALGSPGLDQVRWLGPVFANQTIRAETEVMDVTPSRSKPDRGVLKMQTRAFDEKGKQVLSMDALVMMRTREKGGV